MSTRAVDLSGGFGSKRVLSARTQPVRANGPRANTLLLEGLRAQLRQRESAGTTPAARWVASGYAALDGLLPGGGIRRGSMVEFLGRPGGGAGLLGLFWACRVAGQEGFVMVVDETGWFYPPAAAALGLDLHRLLVIRAANSKDRLWALDQALRCPAVAAVWSWVARLAPADYRRLALAVEQSGVIGLLSRPERVRGQPCWSDVQLWVQPVLRRVQHGASTRRLRVEVTRCRHGRGGGPVELDL